MKKVFAILAVAGFMASCNSGADKEKAAADSTRIADSTHAAWVTDSTEKAKAADTTHPAVVDSASKTK